MTKFDDNPASGNSQSSDKVIKGTHESIPSLVSDVISRPARDEGEKHRWVAYSVVGAEEAAELKKATGLDLEGYLHGIEESAISHILNERGAGSSRLASDEIPFEVADFDRIPEIISTAQDVRTSERVTRTNQLPAIEYVKRVNGWFYVLEEVRTGRKVLAHYSAYKTKTNPRTKRRMTKSPR